MRWNDARFDEARQLHRSGGLLDLHVDSILSHRLFGYDVRRRHRPGLPGQPLLWHADVPRMRDTGYTGACMGIHYWPRETEGAWRELNRQIDYLDRIAEAAPGCLRVRAPGDWTRARREGRLALAPGVEGAHMLNGRIDRVGDLARRGVAYLTLTHFSKNRAAAPSVGRGADEHEGLSDFGRRLVEALNRHGIVVDVAHVSTQGLLDACRLTTAPLLCSHTGVRAIWNAPRNLADEAIDAVAAVDGVIGIFFFAGRKRGSTEVLDNLCYVADRVGVRHVAIGTDFDGWVPLIPLDHRDCRDVVKVTEGLRRRGLADDEIRAILGGNARRVFEAQQSDRY
ncbi:MAG: dipeptidase [Planctomycetota bacterium]|jgi:membrane dipeptidase